LTRVLVAQTDGDGELGDRAPEPSKGVEMATREMVVTKGLLLRVQAQAGKEDEVESVLEEALPIVEGEPETRVWFAIRFGPSSFGIFDVFPDDAGRQAHLEGGVGQALQERGEELFAGSPTIENVDVLAAKIPG
jgi:hypothetical protein